MFDPAIDCWYLAGPTASGKTTTGIELAGQLNAEVISLDSMAVYRGMDIGTAKPTAAERERVAHHLVDVVNPDEPYSLSDYVAAAHKCIDEIRSRGKEVLFVGGTPLYLKSMIRGIFEGPPADEQFRREITLEVERIGNQALHDRLQQVDPLSASRLHPNDVRRIIRALEVYKQTGQPISHLQLQFDQGRNSTECKVFVLEWPRPELHARINARVDQMFENGLVDEVKRVREQFQELSHTAIQAVGYTETVAYLDGQLGIEEAIERTKARTRQFAKRQETWFRGLSECRRIPLTQECEPPDVATRIVNHTVD